MVPTFSMLWKFITLWELQSRSHWSQGLDFLQTQHMSAWLLGTDTITARNTSPELALKGRAGTLSTTEMGIEVGHPLSRFPLFCRWVFIASAQPLTAQNLLHSLFGEHCASKNSYTVNTPSTRQVSFLPLHTSMLLKLLVISISGRAFIFSYKLYIWEYCFPETSRICS